MSIRINMLITSRKNLPTFYVNPDITYQHLREGIASLLGHDKFSLTFFDLTPEQSTVRKMLRSEEELAVFLGLAGRLNNILQLSADDTLIVPTAPEQVKPDTKTAEPIGCEPLFFTPQTRTPLPPASNTAGPTGQPSSGPLDKPPSAVVTPSTTSSLTSTTSGGAVVPPGQRSIPSFFRQQPWARTGGDGQTTRSVAHQKVYDEFFSRQSKMPQASKQKIEKKKGAGGKIFEPLIDDIVEHIRTTMEEVIKDAVEAAITEAMGDIEEYIRAAIEDAKEDM